MSASEDEDAIEAVAADGPHPALSERVRVRRSNRRPDHLDPLGAEDLVKGATELRVAIVEKSQASVLAACWRRNDRHGWRPRSGAGGTSASLSTLRTVVEETASPSSLSSPAIR